MPTQLDLLFGQSFGQVGIEQQGGWIISLLRASIMIHDAGAILSCRFQFTSGVQRDRCGGVCLRKVVSTAVAAVGLEALAIRDEPSAAAAIENHLADALRFRQLDARAPKGLLKVHVLAPGESPADGVDIVGRPNFASACGDFARELNPRLFQLKIAGAAEVCRDLA